MQRALTLVTLQRQHVLSDISGVAVLRIIRAVAAGEQDPDLLAAMRDFRCGVSLQTIRASLMGNYQPEHVIALPQTLALFDSCLDRIADCDQQIEGSLRQLSTGRPESATELPGPHTTTKQADAPEFDVRAMLY